MTEKLIILTKKSSLHSTHLYRTLLQVQTIIEFYKKRRKEKKRKEKKREEEEEEYEEATR